MGLAGLVAQTLLSAEPRLVSAVGRRPANADEDARKGGRLGQLLGLRFPLVERGVDCLHQQWS
jgi:hypothetical protein